MLGFDGWMEGGTGVAGQYSRCGMRTCIIPISQDRDGVVAPGTLDIPAAAWGAGARVLPAARSNRGGLQPAGPRAGSSHRLRAPFPLAACGRSGPGGGRRNPGAPTASRRMWVCRSAAPWRHARPPAATRAPWGSPHHCPAKDRSPWDPTSLGVTPRILLSLCLSRYRLPTLPCRQPEPSPGHQDSPAALPGGRGPARRSPRRWPKRRRRHGGECRRGGHRACSIHCLGWHAGSPPKSAAPCSWLGILGVPLIPWGWDTLAVGVPVGVGASRMLGGLAHPTPQQ